MSERERLRAKSRRLRSEIRKLGPMIKGSVIFREIRCGKPNCKCTRGEPHLYLCVVYALMAITDTFLLNRFNLIKVLVDCLRKLGEDQVFVFPLLR